VEELVSMDERHGRRRRRGLNSIIPVAIHQEDLFFEHYMIDEQGRFRMAAEHVINVDLARVFDSNHKLITTLAWGDAVELVEQSSDTIKIRLLQTTGDDDHLVEPNSVRNLLASTMR
jgi:hypothetical protein